MRAILPPEKECSILRRVNECSGVPGMELSERQRLILEYINDSISRQGYPPTVREIASAVGLCSPASVHGHLKVLEARGFIRRGGAKRRALEVLDRADKFSRLRPKGSGVRLPLVGRVAAGAPALAQENIEEILELPGFLGERDGAHFALRVSGDSMVNAGILDGDIVIVHQQDWAEDGDIVVALIGEEATLKRFFREQDWVRLQPENEHMEPILIREPRIVGKVTGVLRRL